MRPEIASFGKYVERRLDDWGHVFALDRDCEYLGHQSKNILQVLLEHKGEMPARATGFKPLEIPANAHQVELIVTDLSRENYRSACCLRAYWCGSGRKKIERFETALLLIDAAEWQLPVRERKPSVDGYLRMVDRATWYVQGRLEALGAAA